MTQKDLAETLHFSKQEISNWETGLKTPRISALAKIAHFFNVTVSELLDEQVDPKQIDYTARILAAHLDADITEDELHKITDFMDQFVHERS